MNTTTAKRSFKDRVKNRTPEILIGAGAVIAIAGVVIARKNFNPTAIAGFAAQAADPTVEVIAGNDDAFVVMTANALETLEKFGRLDIGDKDAVRYVLSLVNDK